MQLNSLAPHTKHKKNAPVGRGGKRGTTSGRGTKGQKARAGHKIRPEMRDLIKKLPKLRGHGKNRSRTVRTNRQTVAAVNLATLESAYAAHETVSPASLVAKGLVRRAGGRPPAVKLLGAGPLTKAFLIERCALSKAARAALIAAGATIRDERNRTSHA